MISSFQPTCKPKLLLSDVIFQKRDCAMEFIGLPEINVIVFAVRILGTVSGEKADSSRVILFPLKFESLSSFSIYALR